MVGSLIPVDCPVGLQLVNCRFYYIILKTFIEKIQEYVSHKANIIEKIFHTRQISNVAV